MKFEVYKDKQFLVFQLEDGKTVKYDFSTHECIGKRGKPVKNLQSQLSGITIYDVINNCRDKYYADFLSFVHRNRWCYRTGSINTVLQDVPRYAKFEQYFAAGLGSLIDSNLRYKLSDIPKGLVKMARENRFKLTNNLIDSYKENPGNFQLAFSLELENFTPRDIMGIFEHTTYVRDSDGHYRWISIFHYLVDEYNYSPKRLLTYIDDLITYEGLDGSVYYILNEIYDYAKMMKKLSHKFDKYPRYFLSTHKIACRNYNRLKEQFDKEEFEKCIDKSMEKTIGDYVFIYPESTQDIKDEAVSQNNCVASYIKRVINGECHILFMRHKDTPEDSLVTIEVRNNKIVQARQRYNTPCTPEQKEVIEQWEQWRANQVKKEEGDGYACKVA